MFSIAVIIIILIVLLVIITPIESHNGLAMCMSCCAQEKSKINFEL